MRLTRALLFLAGIALAAVGVAYALLPGTALGIAGIAVDPTREFLFRAQGVALVAAGVLLLLIPAGGGWRTRSALVAVAGYLIIGSVVDLRAYLDGLVGGAAVVSATARIAAGALCVLAVLNRRRPALVPTEGSAPPSPDAPSPSAPD